MTNIETNQLDENNEVVVTDTAIENGAPEVSTVDDGKKKSFLYNILALVLSCVFLVAEVFLFISLFCNVALVYGTDLSSGGVSGLIASLMALLTGSGEAIVGLIFQMMLLGAIGVYLIVVVILTLIGLIKTIIGVFGFFKLGNDYESTRNKFLKYTRTVQKSYANVLAFIAVSLFTNDSLTGVGTGVIVLGCLIYVAVAVFNIMYNEEGFFLTRLNTWLDMLLDLIKKLLMFAFAIMLISNIKSDLADSFNTLSGLTIAFYPDVMLTVSGMWFSVIRGFLTIIPFAIAISAMGKIASYYALNNTEFTFVKGSTVLTGRKNVDYKLKSLFITLLVFTLILMIADCIFYGMYYGAGFGDILSVVVAQKWLGYLFLSIAGIVLTVSSIHQTEKQNA